MNLNENKNKFDFSVLNMATAYNKIASTQKKVICFWMGWLWRTSFIAVSAGK